MGKVTFKDPNAVITFMNGRPKLNAANLTDEIYDELVKENPRYKLQFNDERETVKPAKEKKEIA